MGPDILLCLLILSSAIWLGGLVTVLVVARSTSATLSEHDRVAFFRHFGRRFGVVATSALGIAYATGSALLLSVPWNGISAGLVVVAVLLVVVLGLGIGQARGLTRLRRASISNPEDTALRAKTASQARSATILRAGIGLLSLVLLVLAVWRAP